MKFGPIIKKNKKEETRKKPESREETILKLQAEMDMISDRYTSLIYREVSVLKERRRKGMSDDRSVDKINTAFYGLLIIQEAKENLREVQSTTELYNTMNRMNNALKVLNKLSATSEKTNTLLLNYRISKMRKNADRDDGGMRTSLKDMDDYLPTGVVDRLVSGETIQQCLNDESVHFDDMMDGLDFSEMLNELKDEQPADSSVEQNVTNMEDIINSMKNDI